MKTCFLILCEIKKTIQLLLEKKSDIHYLITALLSSVTRIFFSCVLRCIRCAIVHETRRRTQEKNIIDTPLGLLSTYEVKNSLL